MKKNKIPNLTRVKEIFSNPDALKETKKMWEKAFFKDKVLVYSKKLEQTDLDSRKKNNTGNNK